MTDAHKVAQNYIINSKIESVTALSSGHINDTFLVKTDSQKHVVLQKLNSTVFKNIEGLISNKILVSEHVSKADSPYQIVQFVKAKDNNYYYRDTSGEFWMLMNYIRDSVVHEVATNKSMVYEAGKLYGDFILRCSNLDAHKLIETLPDFHSLPFRYSQFERAFEQASEETKKLAKTEIELVLHSKDDMFQLSNLKALNTFPLRVTHNDAKLSNILFDTNNKGLAVIDLDTVMPGITAFDFGDSIRSICSTSKEDDTNLAATKLNLEFYEAYCMGFAKHTKQILTSREIEYLPLGAKTITFTQGLRFLTDFLKGNIYYKTDYDTHNLVRAKNQFKLVKSIQENFETMKQITNKIFNVLPNKE